jgi:ABC-type multidrug transport system fused ATPase/permease subunit
MTTPPSKSFKNIATNALYSLKLTFSSNPVLFSALVAIQVLGSITPFFRNRFFSYLIDHIATPNSAMSGLYFTFLIFACLSFLASLFLILQGQFSRLIDIRLQARLRQMFIGKVSSLDYQHLEGKDTANLISKVDEEFGWRIRQTVSDLNNLFTNFVSLAAVTYVLLPRFPALWIIIFLGQIPQYLIERHWIKKDWQIHENNSANSKMMWDLNHQLQQKNIIAELRINNAVNYLYQKYCQLFDLISQSRINLGIDQTPSKISLTLFSVFINSFCLLYLLKSTQTGQLSLGLFTFYFQTILQTADYFRGLVYSSVSITEQAYHINNFRQVMGLENKINGGHLSLPQPWPPKIEFIDVSFKYPNAKHHVYRHLNLTINPAEEIAIVGANGAGKSTLVKLLCRFYDPTSGVILVNGVNLKEIKLEDWYSQLSYLAQEFNHFGNLNLAENVAIGQPGSINRLQVRRSLKKADASFISKYSQKLDTPMSQRYGGEEPSWGQWQKIAIARIFYRNSPVLILDEPTASIDAVSEYKIFNRLYQTIHGKTLIIISHRFSTVRNAQRIIVIDKGQVVEQGSHAELIKLQGHYAHSFNLQAKGYAEDNMAK